MFLYVYTSSQFLIWVVGNYLYIHISVSLCVEYMEAYTYIYMSVCTCRNTCIWKTYFKWGISRAVIFGLFVCFSMLSPIPLSLWTLFSSHSLCPASNLTEPLHTCGQVTKYRKGRSRIIVVWQTVVGSRADHLLLCPLAQSAGPVAGLIRGFYLSMDSDKHQPLGAMDLRVLWALWAPCVFSCVSSSRKRAFPTSSRIRSTCQGLLLGSLGRVPLLLGEGSCKDWQAAHGCF